MSALSESPVGPDPAPSADLIAPATQVSSPARLTTATTQWGRPDILLTGLVLALLAAAIGTSVQQTRRRQVQTRVAQELNAIAQGLEAYLRDHDAAPPDTAAGIMPTGLAPYLPGMDWSLPTPAGGHYRLINVGGAAPAPTSLSATIALTAFSSTAPYTLSHWDLIEIDRQIDDGDLNSGRFRAGFNHWPFLVVKVRPATP